MTIQSVASPLFYPGTDFVGGFGTTTASMTASGHKLGVVFHAPRTGTIDGIKYRSGTIVNSPSVDVRLETVASGKPSGTLWGTNTNGNSGTLTSNATFETALTSTASVSQGDLIAIVFGWVSNTSQIGLAQGGVWMNEQFPAVYQDTGAGYAVLASRMPQFALRYNDASYATGLGCFWFTALTNSATFSSGEQGIRFRLPFTCRASGLWHTCDPDTALTFNLYADATSPGGTALATRTQQTNEFEAANVQVSACRFASSVTLAANTWYRLVASVSGASTRFSYLDVAAAAELAAAPGGADVYQTVSAGASWTDTTTRQPQMGLVIDGLDDGAGGGGSSIAFNPVVRLPC